jgi:phosphoribosylamine--glycine ligase
VIEEFLAGEEASFFALCDGERAMPSPARRTTSASATAIPGPNTGGMGAYSPAPIMTRR